MIDTHIHIVPGVDDGAQDLAMSMAMIKQAMEEGVTEMVATPHHAVPSFVSREIDQQFQLLQNQINKEKLEFKIHLGNEIRVDEESIAGLQGGMARTMGDSSYLLMELPFHHYYPFHEAMLFDLLMKEYKVVIAHVERYRVFRSDEKRLADMINKGFYGQLTARYVAERKTRKKALGWIGKGYIHVVASDSHDTKKRPCMMKAAYDVVCNKFGRECANALFTDNPKRIIMDEPLEVPMVSNSSWLSIFRK